MEWCAKSLDLNAKINEIPERGIKSLKKGLLSATNKPAGNYRAEELAKPCCPEIY